MIQIVTVARMEPVSPRTIYDCQWTAVIHPRDEER